MQIRRLVPSDAAQYQHLRLTALRDSPTAFGSSYEEECDMPLSVIEARLAVTSGRDFFAAGDAAALFGMVGLLRQPAPKLRHKASIFGMYVAQHQRGKGLGRRLIEQVLDVARGMPGLRQINLTATADNAAALGLYQAMGFRIFGREPCGLMVEGVLYDVVELAMLLDQPVPGVIAWP